MIFGKCSAALLILFCFVTGSVFPEEIIHIVQKNETIYSVARSYGVSPSAVLEVNGMTEGDARLVQAGRRLRIPVTGIPPKAESRGASPAKTEEYRVAKGDTLYSIAGRYKISVPELRNLNGFSSSHVIKEGERIRVPEFTLETGPYTSAAADSRQSASSARVDGSWPVRAKSLSYLTGKLYGVMITGERAESVKSLTQGTVVSAGPYRGFGRLVIVQVPGGYQYVYGGCESLSVKEGDKVKPGTELGRLGVNTKTEKPQLLFLVYRNDNPIDPAKAPRA
jgi:murein DD-endopeptidase MepM/ murein hydrolase activator NlpD